MNKDVPSQPQDPRNFSCEKAENILDERKDSKL